MTKVQNPLVHLLEAANIADYFLMTSKKEDLQSDYVQFSVLESLIALEDVLDKGRGVVAMDAGYSSEGKEEINSRMDNLRNSITELIKKLIDRFGKEKVSEFFMERVNRIQTEWFHLIK